MGLPIRSHLHPTNVSSVGRKPDLVLAEVSRKVPRIRLRTENYDPRHSEEGLCCVLTSLSPKGAVVATVQNATYIL